MADTFKWVVLEGGFSGDGSRDHSLFRLQDERVPFFISKKAAMEFAAEKGKYAVIAEVSVFVEPVVSMKDADTGKEIG